MAIHTFIFKIIVALSIEMIAVLLLELTEALVCSTAGSCRASRHRCASSFRGAKHLQVVCFSWSIISSLRGVGKRLVLSRGLAIEPGIVCVFIKDN